MAQSSCSNSIDSIQYERVACGECGKKALVLVSKSTKNPGRLYYGCGVHGWLKWVVSETEFHPVKRRFTTEKPEIASVICAQNVGRSSCNCKGMVWALIIVNLILLGANLATFVIQLGRYWRV